MRKSAIGKLVVLAGVAAASLAARSANPIFTDTFTADPAPIVVGDTCYVITTQDENDGTPAPTDSCGRLPPLAGDASHYGRRSRHRRVLIECARRP